MRVLGIDPGYQRIGWSVIEGNRSRQKLIGVGCVETSKDDSLNIRLEEVYDLVGELIDEFKPDVVAVEEIFYSKNTKTVIGVSQARGVILLAAVKKKVECFNYNPVEVKKTVAGYGKADKKQVQMMVKSQLGLKAVPKPDDAADACAVAITHMFLSKSRAD